MEGCFGFLYSVLEKIFKPSLIFTSTGGDDDNLFRKLPEDVVIFHILRRLTTKELFRLLQVSKLFKSLISQPHFLNLHISSVSPADHYPTRYHLLLYLDKTPTYRFHLCSTNNNNSSSKSVEIPFESKYFSGLDVVGSAQGVICIYFRRCESLFLWNPLIGVLKQLPPCVQPTSDQHPIRTLYGIGLNPITVDLMVVKILYYDWDECSSVDHRTEAFVYAHNNKTESWKSIGRQHMVPCSPYMGSDQWLGHNNVCVSGVVYWLAYDHDHKQPPLRSCDDDPYRRLPDCIMGFDLVKQVFKVVELPNAAAILITRLGEFRLSTSLDGKYLALFVENFGIQWYWSMFVLKDDICDGKAGSWEKLFTMRGDHIVQPIPIVLVTSRQLIAVSLDSSKPVLISIDVENGEIIEELTDSHSLPFTHLYTNYHPSLALLEYS